MDEARYNRENRVNKAEHPPGQSGGAVFNQNGGSDLFGNFSQTTPVNNNGVGDIFSTNVASPTNFDSVNNLNQNSTFSNGAVAGTPSPNGVITPTNPQQPQSALKAELDRVSADIVRTFPDHWKAFASGLKGTTIKYWNAVCTRSMIAGAIIFGVSVLLRLFGWQGANYFLLGGGISAIIYGAFALGTTNIARQYSSFYVDENNSNAASGTIDNTQPSMEIPDILPSNETFPEPSQGYADEDDYGYGDEDDYGGYDDPYASDDDWDFDAVEATGNDGMSVEEALNTFQSVPTGMYTRQYLYDTFTKVLPTMKPNFNVMVEVDEDSDEFMQWSEEYCLEAALAVGFEEDDDDLPNLIKLQKNLFTYVVTCEKTKRLKPDAFAVELAKLYSYKDGEFDPKVYAKCETVGRKCIVTIFTGKNHMITVKDMFDVEKDFMLDSKNIIPVVMGVDPRGKVIKADLRKLESIIIAGMPRSGKSWLAQAVLTQMCFFVSPKELNIYICDPKEGISDFKMFRPPHVKKFEFKDDRIVQLLRNLVKVEAPRRKKIIGDAGFVNIWDFKKKYPDVHLPVVYVMIDEIVTLASRMDKETNQEFRMLLRELISQLPALGIRAFLIPHVLNNDIIEKKTSDLVPCRISVMGSADHIEKVTGAKPKDFPYKLAIEGDMAVKLPLVNPNVMYMHGVVLTDDNNKNMEIFDYMRRIWSTLEPDEVTNSQAIFGEYDAYCDKLLKEGADKSANNPNQIKYNSGDMFDPLDGDDSSSQAVNDFLENLF